MLPAENGTTMRTGCSGYFAASWAEAPCAPRAHGGAGEPQHPSASHCSPSRFSNGPWSSGLELRGS